MKPLSSTVNRLLHLYKIEHVKFKDDYTVMLVMKSPERVGKMFEVLKAQWAGEEENLIDLRVASGK